MVIRNFSLTYQAQASSRRPVPQASSRRPVSRRLILMDKSDHSEERRAARRFEVTWAVAIKGKEQTGESFEEAGTLQNLSSRGAFFFLPKRVRLGARLEVEIRVPMKEKSWMKYSAKVVRVKRQKSDFAVAVNFATARPIFIER
jgi:hypothetical protein